MNTENGKKMRHKETFHQSGEDGLPAHWVVQFYIDGQAFCEAAYFNTFDEAMEFEEELDNDYLRTKNNL